MMRKRKKDEEKNRKNNTANVSARLERTSKNQDKLLIENRGPAAAKNVQLEFLNGNSPLPQGTEQMFPINNIQAGNSTAVPVALHNQCYPPFNDVLIKWSDDSGDHQKTITI